MRFYSSSTPPDVLTLAQTGHNLVFQAAHRKLKQKKHTKKNLNLGLSVFPPACYSVCSRLGSEATGLQAPQLTAGLALAAAGHVGLGFGAVPPAKSTAGEEGHHLDPCDTNIPASLNITGCHIHIYIYIPPKNELKRVPNKKQSQLRFVRIPFGLRETTTAKDVDPE